MSIQNTSLTTVASNIYVSSGNSVISTMYFCNTYTAAVYFNVYIIPAASSGFAANVATQIYSNVQLASNDTYVADWEKLVLGPGDQIRANITNASANAAVTSTVSYVGI